MSYHQTTKMSAEDLRAAVASATALEEAVMALFRATGGKHSPSQICGSINAAREAKGRKPYPITSVRRAITDLTEAGELVKLDAAVDGPYGRPEGLWQFAAA